MQTKHITVIEQIKIIMTLLFCIFVGFLVGYASQDNDNFEADRACRPGMLLKIIDSEEALCIGGNKETWVVKY